MGVHGLWRLIEPSGKPVPLETLENKVLAVDVSIWLHQAIKGFQDSKGAPVPNAHLLGIYHRVCKLLYFKVKPVFIFDGGVPALKKQTIAKRHQLKSRNITEADRLQKQLLNTLLKHTAISKVLSEKTKASLTIVPKKLSKQQNIYALPPSELDSTISSSDDEDLEYTSDTTDSSPAKHWDLHTIDMSSVHFKSLPVDVRHEILTELKETRKQNSWGRLHELPKQSNDFSVYQMRRLLKRQAVQSALEDAEKEMGGHSLSMAELESILKDHGVVTTNDIGKRIASDESTRYLLIKDVKQAMEKARKEEQFKLESQQEDNADKIDVDKPSDKIKIEEKNKTKAELEFEDDLQKAIALSLQEEPSTSKTEEVTSSSDGRKKLEFSFLENFNDADFQSDSSEEIEEVAVKKTFSSAQNYMMEYSGLTPNEIAKIMNDKSRVPLKKGNGKKNIEKPPGASIVEIMSDSDDSRGFVEVSQEDREIKNSNGVTSKMIEKHFDKVSEATETLIKNDKFDIASASCSDKSNEFMGTQGDTKIDNNITNTVSTEKCVVSSHKSNEVSKYQNIEIVSSSTDSTENNNDLKIMEKADECLINLQSANDAMDVSPKNIKSKAIEKTMDIEIMSDSESSSSIEFIEVSENKLSNNAVEIVIDPNQSIKDDDLFGDIFQGNKSSQNKESIEIVIQPQLRPGDDLFSDVFQEKLTVVEGETNTYLNKQISEKKRTLEFIEEHKILVIQDTKKSLTREEVAQSSKKEEVIDKIVIATKNSSEVNQNYADTSTIEKPLENDGLEVEIMTIEKQKMNVEQMRKLKQDLQKERVDLLIEKSTKERMASNITDQMSQEAQDLLELFGVPYIVAPMEAEAQCAFLDEIELTDGTITDDSDIWLFGGRTVYKNFFNQSKYVMEFKAEDIKHNFKLTREQLILFALLVGSDYTTGIQGVGPVTALEILAAFPPSQSKEFTLSRAQLISGLKEFRSWFNRGQTAGPGRSALKNKLNNISFTENFPSLQVVEAYLEPTVETSKDKFSWGKPNFIGLKEFAREKFGWSAKKAEEILKPVIKRVEESRVQKSIKDFFKTVHKVHSHEAENKMSKRVKTAINRIGKTPDELIAEEMEALSKTKQKKTRKKKNVENNQEAEGKDVQNKPVRKRIKQKKEENTCDSSKATVAKSEENIDMPAEQCEPPRSKRIRKKSNKAIEDTPKTIIVATTEKSSEESQPIESIDEDTDELEKYEKIAIELRKRRQRKNDLCNKEDIHKKRQNKPPPKKNLPTENIPKVLDDEEVQVSKASTSRSLKRVEEINQEVNNKLNLDAKKKRLQIETPKQKKNKKIKVDKVVANTSEIVKMPPTEKGSDESQIIENVDKDTNELEKYENIAIELKKRREKKNDVSNKEYIHMKRENKLPRKKDLPAEDIPKVLEEDEEVQVLRATTSRSLKRVEEINHEVKNELNQDVKKKRLPNFHQKEVIHQKLRDKSNLLRNKLKAIEVFRKSKKGPGYVKKQSMNKKLLKEDAELSENSSDD